MTDNIDYAAPLDALGADSRGEPGIPRSHHQRPQATAVGGDFSDAEIAGIVKDSQQADAKAKGTLAAAYPAGLDAAVTAYANGHKTRAALVLQGEDAMIAEVRAKVRPQLEALVESYDLAIRNITAMAIGRNALITPAGRDAKLAEVREAHQQKISEVMEPLRERLKQGENYYERLSADQDRRYPEAELIATDVAQRLGTLTPTHGLPLVAELIHQCAVLGKVGPVRAVLPILQSLLERQGGEYSNNADLFSLIRQAESLTDSDNKIVARQRRVEIQQAEWALGELETAARAPSNSVDRMVFTMSVAGSAGPMFMPADGRQMVMPHDAP